MAETDNTTTNANEKSGSNEKSQQQLNSKVLSHLQSYPVVNDTVSYCCNTPYGAKSLSLLSRTYNSFIAPLHPYLATPYSYVSPYLTHADELGDTGLSRVESRFPIVKEDTTKLKATITDYVSDVALTPVKLVGQGKDLANQGKEYVLGTWEDEYQKVGGDTGIVKSVRALISTELRIGSEGYKYVSDVLARRKAAQEQTAEKQ